MRALRAMLLCFAAIACASCAEWNRALDPVASLQRPVAPNTVLNISRDGLSEPELVDAVRRTLERMQYRIESCDRDFGLVVAAGGKVTYNPALVAAGTAALNGAVVVAQVLGGGAGVVGLQLDSSYDFRIYVQVWRHPSDTRARARAFFVRTTRGSLGALRREPEVAPEQFDAFFKLLDAEIQRAPEVHR